jgi:NADH dehydrogenase
MEFAPGDVTSPETLPAALEGVDAVIHCVGIIIEPRGITFESVVRDGTRNLVEACRKSGVKRIVYISALGTRPNASSRYHQTKWAAEELIRKSEIPFTILRPSIVYGPKDQFLNRFLKMPFIVLPGGGKALFQPTYVKDLAHIVCEAVDNPALQNQTLDTGGPEKMTYREVMKTAVEAAGKRKPMISLPMGFMKLIATIHDPFQRIYPPLALLTKDQYLMMQEDNAGDNSALHKALPELKLYTFREGLEEYIRDA